jgi:hypothetical protein
LGSNLSVNPGKASFLGEQSLQLVSQPIASQGYAASSDSLSVGLVADRTIEEPSNVRVQVLVDRAEADLDTFLGPVSDVPLGPLLGEARGCSSPNAYVQDVGQRPESGKADVLERLPVARDGVGVEEDAAGSDLQRAGRALSLALEVEPELPRTT